MTRVKWLMLIAALAAMPWAIRRGREQASTRVVLAFLVGFLPFFNVDLNLVSDPAYRGDTRGLEISLVDLVAWTLLATVPRGDRWPYRRAALLYLAIAFISIAFAPRPEFALYGALKIGRLFVLAIVVERAVRAGLGPSLLRGLAIGVVYVCVIALDQRYRQGMMQVHGPFVHQNGIGMTIDLIAPAMLGLLLAGFGGRLAGAALICGALAIVLSLSRGALLMMPLACTIVYVGSLRRSVTRRKLALIAIAALGAVIVVAKSMDSLVERFTEAPDASAHGRELFEASAAAMVDDHPFGIGINQFSWVQSHRGYADEIGIPDIDRDGIVHNIYRLTQAELGWPGLVAFALLLATPLFLGVAGLVRAWRSPDPRVDLLLGFTASLVVTYLHGMLEWSLRITPIAQVQWIVFGFIAALAGSLRDASAPR